MFWWRWWWWNFKDFLKILTPRFLGEDESQFDFIFQMAGKTSPTTVLFEKKYADRSVENLWLEDDISSLEPKVPPPKLPPPQEIRP